MLKKYLKKFIPFSAFVAIILIIIGFYEIFKEVMPFAWLCFALFFVLSIVSFYFSSRTMQSKFRNFMNVFFAGIIAKLIITAIVILIYKSSFEIIPVTFMAPFAIVYFSFLFFETAELVKLSKKT